MFLFWLLIIIGFIYLLNNGELNNLFTSKNSGSYGNNKRKDPVEIIKERYAKGEINKDEYDEMMGSM